MAKFVNVEIFVYKETVVLLFGLRSSLVEKTGSNTPRHLFEKCITENILPFVRGHGIISSTFNFITNFSRLTSNIEAASLAIDKLIVSFVGH